MVEADAVPLKARKKHSRPLSQGKTANVDVASESGTKSSLAARYAAVRALTEEIAQPLTAEDQTIQSMPDASPTKWHRAHTTWFFETFVLKPNLSSYRLFADRYGYLFNSYYEAVGPRHARPSRGMITRPGVADVTAYRRHVDAAMAKLLDDCPQSLMPLIEIGLNHEQQHQELILTDIKHAFSLNPLHPIYIEAPTTTGTATPAARWLELEGGIYSVGHRGKAFAFDNEGPSHDQLLRRCRIMDRPVSVGEFLAFVDDGGYGRPEFWLSDGWATIQSAGWEVPAYWLREGREGDRWSSYTLHGLRPLDPREPVAHVSFYEAAAYAAWAGKRLPSEFEWEVAAQSQDPVPNWDDAIHAHPRPLQPGPMQDVWEWTASAYQPYPGFHPAAGAIGEYNGKFMINQMVLRGRSCATPPGHHRPTYRNFFPPAARWQFSGFRLAEDV
jgi:ergothioneine biosynthesis protein EgtB